MAATAAVAIRVAATHAAAILLLTALLPALATAAVAAQAPVPAAPATATVKLSRLRGRERVEITIMSSGTIFRGEETDTTFRNALDLALEAIERQIRKNKTKLEKRLREGALSDLYEVEEPPVEDDEIIIRTKTFQLKPMTPEEAILQMNLLGHDFFVYADSQTGETNVVYRRHDKAYGLIEPSK